MTQNTHPGFPTPDCCTVPDCGRPTYAVGLCQTHHRQLKTTGELRPIRPYHHRRPGTVKFAGFRVSPECARIITRIAEKRGLSRCAVISEILDDWTARHETEN